MAMPKNHYFLFGILILFSLFSIVSISGLTFEKDITIDLTFPCTYNGTICPVATECNLSIIYPNGSLMLENKQATYTGSGIANYTLPDSSINGDYKAPLTCLFPDGNSESGNADFTITPNGEEPELAKSILYLGLILIILVLFIICIYSLLEIDNFSWKIGILAMAYILLNGFLLMCWKLAEMFLTSIPFIEPLFKVLYITSNVGYFPVFLGLVVYLLIKVTDENNINKLVGRGYDKDLATRIARGRKR